MRKTWIMQCCMQVCSASQSKLLAPFCHDITVFYRKQNNRSARPRHFNHFSRTDFIRQNLMYVNVRFCRIKSVPVLKELTIYKGRGPIAWVFKWNWKSLLRHLWLFQIWKKSPCFIQKYFSVVRVNANIYSQSASVQKNTLVYTES